MKNKPILLDLFSGMGGFHKGLSDAGFDFGKAYYSEIDKHAIANYKYNFPHAKYIGSVTDILQSGIRQPDIITFGSPCQDFSLAGKREGLTGDKSSLIQEAITAVSHYRPDVFIWENVKGAFNSNSGEDFWAIIKAFANIGGYGLEWQLVNTSWLLPQNRERIYLVGHLTTSFRDWRTVFPIGENEIMAIETQPEKRKTNKIISTITASNESKLNLDANYILSKGHGFVEDSVSEICPTVRSSSFEHNTAVIQLNSDSKHQTDRVYSEEGIMCCIPNSRAETKINVLQGYKIRRLTEIECERLQGFPDNWTQYGLYLNKKVQKYIFGNNKRWRTERATMSLLRCAINQTNLITKGIPKTQRYKMCGNAVTAKMVELIGKRILKNF